MALLEPSRSASRRRDGWIATLGAEPHQRRRSAAAHCGCEWMKVIAGGPAPISKPSRTRRRIRRTTPRLDEGPSPSSAIIGPCRPRAVTDHLGPLSLDLGTVLFSDPQNTPVERLRLTPPFRVVILQVAQMRPNLMGQEAAVSSFLSAPLPCLDLRLDIEERQPGPLPKCVSLVDMVQKLTKACHARSPDALRTSAWPHPRPGTYGVVPHPSPACGGPILCSAATSALLAAGFGGVWRTMG